MNWFAYIMFFVNLAIIYFMPKRLTRQEIYIAWGILSSVTLNTDLFFGNLLDKYDFVSSKITFSDLLFQATVPPSFGVIFLNFMPTDRGRFIKYIIGWVIFSVVFEAISVKVDFLIYKGWKIWYSAVIYLLVFLYLRWHYFFIKKVLRA